MANQHRDEQPRVAALHDLIPKPPLPEAKPYKIPKRLRAILPVDFFSFRIRAAVVRNSQLVDPYIALSRKLRTQFYFNSKILSRQSRRLQSFPRHHFVASLDVGEGLIIKDVEY